MLRHFRTSLLATALVATASAAAADGRVELNQATIDDSGGFPFTLAAPGSYVLTGDILVPAGITGLRIAADRVTIDLNGFAVYSSFSCESKSCEAESGIGIEAVSAGPEIAADTTVRNGVVSGFGDDCLALGASARVEGLVVRDCAGSGIKAAGHATVVGTRIGDCGSWGLEFAAAAIYGENIITGVNRLGGSGFVSGGTANGHNICDDLPCEPTAPRRFYVTNGTYAGSQALTACAPGYHMASLWEILDPTLLRYDTSLGTTTDDSGSGPPASVYGWVRTGAISSTAVGAGTANCGVWGTPSESAYGTIVRLHSAWANTTLNKSNPWQAFENTCDANTRVWCVAD